MMKSEIEKLKELIERDKKASVNKKTPRYSLNTKREIVKLAKTMSPRLIVTELGVSKSFVSNLIRKAKKNSLPEKQNPSPIQFLQLNDQINNFVKEDAPKRVPTIRLNTEIGVTIEIFS